MEKQLLLDLLIKLGKKYYRPEKLYDKTEDEMNEQSNANNKRKGKGSYHKSNNDYYYYASKKPKDLFKNV